MPFLTIEERRQYDRERSRLPHRLKAKREYATSEHRKAKRNKRYAEDKEFREKHKSCVRASWLKVRWGLSNEDFENLWLSQDKKCPICKEPIDLQISHKTAIDHDHKTGKVRGFVHQKCNLAIAWAESGILIDNAIEYVRKHSGK